MTEHKKVRHRLDAMAGADLSNTIVFAYIRSVLIASGYPESSFFCESSGDEPSIEVDVPLDRVGMKQVMKYARIVLVAKNDIEAKPEVDPQSHTNVRVAGELLLTMMRAVGVDVWNGQRSWERIREFALQ